MLTAGSYHTHDCVSWRRVEEMRRRVFAQWRELNFIGRSVCIALRYFADDNAGWVRDCGRWEKMYKKSKKKRGSEERESYGWMKHVSYDGSFLGPGKDKGTGDGEFCDSTAVRSQRSL